MQPRLLIIALCCFATSFAVSINTVKWCVISEPELEKCSASKMFTCVRKAGTAACLSAIKDGHADAITLSAEFIFQAGLRNYDLEPIVAEVYSQGGPCHYSVAVAKAGTTFGLQSLKGKKSCHSGLGTSEGWTLPLGTLLIKRWMNWESHNQHLYQAVSEFFAASCVPGMSGYPNLCQLCKGDCSASSTNEYYGSAGALKCLAEDAGQVAFMNPADIPASERHNYELLCPDNTRTSVENYRTCNLGEEPARAVVTRKDKFLAEVIWTTLQSTNGFNLFSSEAYGGKDLLFSDSAARLVRVPPDTDSFLYLGAQYVDKLRSLLTEHSLAQSTPTIRWCSVGPANGAENAKCDIWSGKSFNPDTEISAIECRPAPSVEECFKRIMRKEADAISVDGGQVYTAGKCGLVPVMVEQYNEGNCGSAGEASSYHAVAVIKKDSGVTWGNLQGKRSCHTGMGRTAGWNVPMGQIHKATNNCNFAEFFSSSCAPGADPSSKWCSNCKGSGKTVGDELKCSASADELYYGYAGAFRCLAEGAGDVAFIKHTIVGENTNGNGPEWARGLRSDDYELICPGKEGSVPISDFASCNLATVPAHAVITRPEMRAEVIRILNEQQAKFGPKNNDFHFQLFESAEGKNLLFKDSTKCLQEIQADSFKTFLGADYLAVMESLRECSGSTPDLEKSCVFQTCQ